MRRPAPPALALALGAIAVLPLASCGGEDAKLLPGETAREITENLDRVRAFAGEGECVAAADAAQEVEIQVEALQGVDPKLKRALEEGTVRLEEAIASCEEAPEPVPPAEETTEERAPEPPEKEEKQREKELEKLEKEEEKAEKEEEKREEQEVEPPEEAPKGPPEEVPPSEGGGVGAPGGVGPGSAVGGE